jgi:hypothetical protein
MKSNDITRITRCLSALNAIAKHPYFLDESVADEVQLRHEDGIGSGWVASFRNRREAALFLRDFNPCFWDLKILLKEIIESNPSASMTVPINIFSRLLAQVAIRASQLNDKKMNSLMKKSNP